MIGFCSLYSLGWAGWVCVGGGGGEDGGLGEGEGPT